MELIWLEDFVELARSGNFSRAAETRHVTQPAFSRRIRSLEDWAGVTLFDRGSHPVALTAAGHEFQPLAVALIRGILEARAHVREIAAAETATIRFAATHTLSQIFFPGWLNRMEEHGTHWVVHLTSDTLAAVETVFIEGKAQFLLCHAHEKAPLHLPDTAFVSAVVGGDQLVPCATPAVAKTLGADRSATDKALVEKVPLLVYSTNSGLGRILRSVLGERLPRLGAAPAFMADLAGSLRAVCLEGRGVAWLPATLIMEDLSAGRLVIVGGPDWPVPVNVLLFRPRSDLPPVAEGFWRIVLRSIKS